MPQPTPADLQTPPLSRARRWWSALWLDIALGTLGVAMGWMSLLFPYGRDHGLFHYVAREWLVRGKIPYKDTLDHKTPGIYILQAAVIWLLGDNMWGIRLIIVGAVLTVGLMAATFPLARGAPPPPGVRGVSILAANVFFFGLLSFWDSHQVELWYSLLGVACVWAARRIEHERRAQLVAGLIAGAALVMKPPVFWFLLVAAWVLCARVREAGPGWGRRAALALLRFGAAAAVVVLAVLGYFAAHGAMREFFAIVVRSNAYYVAHETQIHTLRDVTHSVFDALNFYDLAIVPLLLGMVLGLGVALGRGDRALRDRHVLALALGCAGLAAVVMQKKFYLAHWSVLIAPVAVMSANAAVDFRDLLPLGRARKWGPVLFAVALLGLWWLTPGSQYWLEENRTVIGYLRGDLTRAEFTRFFQLPGIGFFAEDSERVGNWLREHSSPEDCVSVRGFEPQIYVIANRRYPGRFFWTTFLVSDTRGEPEVVQRWNAEDAAVLAQTPPRFAVTLSGIPTGPDSTEWFLSRGYVVREVMNEFTIVEFSAAPAEPR
jgi:hypothetical protein